MLKPLMGFFHLYVRVPWQPHWPSDWETHQALHIAAHKTGCPTSRDLNAPGALPQEACIILQSTA